MTIRPMSASSAESIADTALGRGLKRNKPIPLVEVSGKELPRLDMHDAELNRVLGGGLVPGSLVLLGGEPGIGKSTLLLQTILQLQERVLYISGEESEQQIKLRADRLGISPANILLLCETNMEQIFTHIKNVEPQLIVVDSIQTMTTESQESAAGSVTQIRECAAALLKYAKESSVPVVLVGHITKDGAIAGPKVLEHIVDTVLQFEGDRHYLYRILRSIKNRFGSTSELGIYEMRTEGLRPVGNPSERRGHLCRHRRRSPLPHRGASTCQHGCIRYSTAERDRFRPPPTQYVVGSFGKTRRVQTRTKGRVSQHCRWYPRDRSSDRLERHCQCAQ